VTIDLLTIWKTKWEIDMIPDPTGAAYPQKFADFLGDRVDGKMTLGPPAGGVPPVFTFNRAVFAANVAGITPSGNGPVVISNAFNLAVAASVMLASPGFATTDPPTPGTTFSVVNSCVVDPASLASATSTLLADITAIPLADDKYPPTTGTSTEMPDYLLAAFASLQYQVDGLDSKTGDAGPNPLSYLGGVI